MAPVLESVREAQTLSALPDAFAALSAFNATFEGPCQRRIEEVRLEPTFSYTSSSPPLFLHRPAQSWQCVPAAKGSSPCLTTSPSRRLTGGTSPASTG